MSPQSTREKMRRAVKRAIKDQDRCMANLKTLDEIAQGQSQYVDDTVHVIVKSMLMLQDAMVTFLNSL